MYGTEIYCVLYVWYIYVWEGGVGRIWISQGVRPSYKGAGDLVRMEHGYILFFRMLENEGLNCIACVGDTFVDSYIY